MDSLDEILRFAIGKRLMQPLSTNCGDRSPGVKKTFEELAKMEEGHKKSGRVD